MTDPNHGNSIITRLRLIIEEMREVVGTIYDDATPTEVADGIRAKAENLLPLANVDDIEVIVLREAAAILNGRGWHDLSDKVEAAGDAFAAEDAARLGGPTNQDKVGKTLRRVVARSDAAPWEQEAAELMGLTITRHNAGRHVQLREGTSILAEWWPGKGTTMRGGKRGPLCATGEDLIAWLRSID